MTYDDWKLKHAEAAADLEQIMAGQEAAPPTGGSQSESYAQQQARFAVAKAGGLTWRNNVGATPAKIVSTCPRCSFKFESVQRPVRYGLANDSHRLNEVIKSSDLIGIMPRLITSDMVGKVVGQFVAIECKHGAWTYTGKGREAAQAGFLALVMAKGGLGQFSTGGVSL